MYCKAKKNFGAIRKFLKIFIFENLLHKKCLKGGISIYADFGPPMTQSVTDRLRVAAAFLLDRRLAVHTGKPGWKIKGITLAKLMNRWREGKNSSCASCV